MADHNRCPHCGADIPEASPRGVCPRCLMKAGLYEKNEVTADVSVSIEGPGTEIGHYELLELIGEGGMGLVYLAEQHEPIQRRVALKIVKLGMDTMQVVTRFLAEQQTLARLDHPNIAKVFDAGTTESGRPYFVMEYVEGTSITKYCDDRKLSIEERLRLFKKVCEGVHHAHQKGIIHRDIKPSNVLVSTQENRHAPKIIDFGVAKALSEPLADATSFTREGQLLGTPEYMSPEQVDLAAADIDTRADIYSLGVLLYELLAGALPFDREVFKKAGLAEIQKTIREEEPATPSTRLTSLGEKAKEIAKRRQTQLLTLARRLHRELEWIPMKAMRKDRTRRYRSASELADDVENYLTGMPLMAGPESSVYRARKFMRKHAGSVTTVALVGIALIMGLLASTAMAYKADQARTVAEDQSEEYRQLLYVHQIALADASYRDGNVRRTEELLEACPNDLRSWEWNRLNHICDQSIMTITGAEQTIRSAILSPDGKFIVSNGWGSAVKLWNAEDGTELKTLSGHEGNVLCIALSPDGKQIASGSKDKTVKLWDVETANEVATLRGHTQQVMEVQFSPDGARIASAEEYDIIKIWERSTGKEMITIEKERTDVGPRGVWVRGLAFSPDGRHIASGGDGEIGIWDVDSGAEVMTIAAAHKDFLTDIAYSPDGMRIVSCGSGDPRIRIWDAATGEEVMTLPTRNLSLGCVNYDRSGDFIVSTGSNSTIDIWDAATGENVTTLRGHHRPAYSAVFSPGGSRIISSGSDKTIKVWDASSSPEQFFIQTPVRQAQVWFSPDGRHFATAGGTFVPLTVWDARTGVELRSLSGQTMAVYNCAFSPDGKRVVLGQRHLTVRVWSVETGQILTVFRGHDSNVFAVAFSPDGKSVASAAGGIIKIWDAATGSESMSLEDETASTIISLTYTPDGSRLISYGTNKTIRVWDVANGREILAIEKEGGRGCYLAVSRDGKLIALSHEDSTIPIWDATTGKRVMTLRGHNGIVTMVAFSPAANRLVSCCPNDGTVKVWDTTTGMELMTLDADARTVAFGPDGSTVAAACGEEIVLWETKEPVGGRSPRLNAQAVRQLVGRLHEEHGTYPEVRDQLSGDDTLDQTTRQMALQVVDCRIPQEAYAFAWDVLTTVLPFEKDNQVYEPILVKLEEANRLVPDEGTVLQALGAVQCRLGAYEDALKSLAESWRILSDLGYTSNPATVAYQAKALYEVGRIGEAKAALAKLRKQLDQAGTNWWGGRIGQALLSEMEGLLEDTDP